MTIWISLPSSVVPEPSASPGIQVVDAWYQRICHVFGYDTRQPEDALLLPRAVQMDTEDLAACAIKQILKNTVGNESQPVEMLVDCRSSAAIGGAAPTYRLAAKSGLRNVLPFSLAGQAGTEVAQALTFIQHMTWDKNKIVVISAVQRVVPPDTRTYRERFPLGDAATAIIVACSPMVFAKSFRVLSVTLGQSGNEWGDNLDTVINRAAENAKITVPDIRWAIAHRSFRQVGVVGRLILPNAVWLTRDLCPDVDFGCSDSLLSLQRVFASESHCLTGIGAIWFSGRFGATAVVLLDSE